MVSTQTITPAYRRQRIPRDLLQLLLVTIGLGYPIARQILPGTARITLLLPLALLLLWLVWRLRRPPALIQSPLGGPLLLCAIALTGSSLFAAAESGAVAAQLFHWGAVAVLLFLTIDLLACGWQPAIFTRAILLATSVGLLHATWSIVAWWGDWLALWQPGEPLFPVGFRQHLINTQPNQAAMIINIALPLAIAALWRARTLLVKVMWAGWLLLATLVIFYTSSRGGWLAMAAVVSMMLAPLLWSTIRARQWRRLGVTLALTSGYAALFVALFLLNFTQIVAHRTSASVPASTRSSASTPTPPTSTVTSSSVEPKSNPNSVEPTSTPDSPTLTPTRQSSGGSQALQSLTHSTGRTIFWSRALQFFGENPVTGIGPAGYIYRYAAEESASRQFRAPHAHSIYLTVLSEGGLLGVAALLVLILSTMWVWWRGWRMQAGADEMINDARLLLLACGAAGVGMLVHGVVDVPVIETMGRVLYTVAIGLSAAHCWRLTAPATTTHDQERSERRFPRALQIALVVVAVLAWVSSILVISQRNQWETLRNDGALLILQGDLDQALQHYNAAIALYPAGGAAYSERAAALAWYALDEPAMLPVALQAQTEALHRDPTSYHGVLNYAMLLDQMGETERAIAELEAFRESDRTRWWLTSTLLARLYEQSGQTAAAQTAWERALKRSQADPYLAESAACQQSEICSAMPPLNRRYIALVETRQLAAAVDANALPRIWALANTWNSVDMWAVGALLARRVGDEQEQQRFLTAALDRAATVGEQQTPQLAVVLLHDAMERGDEAAMRRLIMRWIDPPDMRVVPQITHLLITTTDVELAQVAHAAAQQLDDEDLQQRTNVYLDFVEAAMEVGREPER